MYDLHVRISNVRAFRRLLRALDNDIELVQVRRSEGERRRWTLQMVPQPPRPGSTVDLIRRAALEHKLLVPEDLVDIGTGHGPGTACSELSAAGGGPDEAAEK